MAKNLLMLLKKVYKDLIISTIVDTIYGTRYYLGL